MNNSTEEVMDTIAEKCAACRFWTKLIRDDGLGRCRRYPPQQQHVPGCWVWPLTHEDDWCGEYQSPSRDGGEK